MAYDFQVAVDAAQPHVLAQWWASAIGWVVEPTDATFIRRMIAEGHATNADTFVFNGALVWKDGAAIRRPEDPDGAHDSQYSTGPGSRILFQLVPEAKVVKNRWHLDVRVGGEKVEAEMARLIASGATFLHRANQGPHEWVTMADPEGNEFCIT